MSDSIFERIRVNYENEEYIHATSFYNLLQVCEMQARALKDCGDYFQDQLARANQAIEADCPNCDYQCEGCIRSIDDCESAKKNMKETLTQAREKLEGLIK